MKNVVDHKNSTLYALSDAGATKEWIQLQLKDKEAIERIKIVYGSDCCGEDMPKMESRVGDNEVTTDNYEKMLKENYLCDKHGNMEKQNEKTDENLAEKEENVQTDKTTRKLNEQRHIENPNKILVIACSTPVTGKYVTIQMTDKNVKKVDIAEVKIYGPIIGNYRILHFSSNHNYYILPSNSAVS